ncbi:MAG: glycerol-3-phosphate dehydrogenase/oxidase [Firmicutes bacterium]|nr:glycerol-3-phosphate dehydrogenase/oxidase [Bacillota bacterium]
MTGREEKLQQMRQPWDIIVVGGGITGAGVLREAAGLGLRCLLLEQRDFGWGTSSRSGKLVHGGLRYLKQGQVRTTRHSVREREKLLREYRGLVEPLEFMLPVRRGAFLEAVALRAGLTLYDLLAGHKSCRRCDAAGAARLVPELGVSNMAGAFLYRDAGTDDARLVLRVLGQGQKLGGAALNYVRVEEPLPDRSGRVRGLAVRDVLAGGTAEIQARVVINATGVWADQLRGRLGAEPRLRPLRGSHLIFSRRRFPLRLAVSFAHPRDRRPVYVFPWEGVTLLGTTDVDHLPPLDVEPRISPEEGQYLLDGVRHVFPSLELTPGDVVSTFAGVRPVVHTGQKDPSKESRDHVIWDDDGLVTVTGGKLTTFGLLARQALARAGKWLDGAGCGAGSGSGAFRRSAGQVEQAAAGPGGAAAACGEPDKGHLCRLYGRYGPDADALLAEAGPGGLETVPGTETLWVELRWAARREAVVHLDDLLLRRTRLGHLLPAGGAGLVRRLRRELQPVLGWDDRRWDSEWRRYTDLLFNYPAGESVWS